MADTKQQQQQQQQPKAQAVNWLNAPLASQPSGEVLAGTAITGGGTMSGYTPLYDAQTGGFAGWQDPKGGYYQAVGGNYGNYNTRTGEMYAPPTYPPPQQPQQPQQQQQPSLADMWNSYMRQGAQQPLAQQQPAQSNITPVTPYGGQQLAAATPFATIPGTMPTVAPPPAPGAGQQQWQPQQIQRFQQGGMVLPQQAAANPSSAALTGNTGNLLNLLGGAALQEPAYINPTPQPQTPGQFNPGLAQGNSFGGGVNTGTFQPTQSSDIPVVPGSQMSWYQVAMGAGLSPNDIAAFQQRGYTPNQVAQKFNLSTGTPGLGGPWSTTPGLFAQAPRLAPTAGTGATWASQLTPTPPAFAAQGAQAPTPWATAPPAPGVNLAGIGGMPRPMGGMPQPVGATAMPPVPPETHLAGLANAGMAFYGHVTGKDPREATPDQILDFHRRVTDQIAQYTAGANPSAASLPGTPPGGGAAPQVPAASAATTALKARSGGLVPGRGNGDTVPALLTPGEYVLNRQQTAQLFGGRTPIKMQSGGEVPDDSSAEPPEARRRRLEVAAANADAAPQAQSSSAAGSQSSSWSPPGLGGYTGPTAGQISAQNAAANNRIGSGGPGSLDALGTLGDEPLIGSMGIGVGSGAGSGVPTQQAAGVISGLASSLSSAMDAYAKSIGSWQMQKQDFGGPASAPTEPVTRFAQNAAQPTTRQPQNPMLNPYYQLMS